MPRPFVARSIKRALNRDWDEGYCGHCCVTHENTDERCHSKAHENRSRAVPDVVRRIARRENELRGKFQRRDVHDEGRYHNDG